MQHNLLLKNWSQMPKIILITVLLFLSGLLVGEAENVSDENTAARVLSEQLAENLNEDPPFNIKIQRLVYEGYGVSSAFADNLLSIIKDELKNNDEGDFPSVVELEREVKNRGLKILPDEDEKTEAKDGYLEGSYRDVKDRIIVELRLVLENGTSFSRAEISLPISGLKHEWKPRGLDIIKQSQNEASKTIAPKPNDFSIKIKFNKEKFIEYDSFEIFFKSDIDCYLVLLYQDVDGNRHILPTKKDYFRRNDWHDNITDPLKIECPCGAERIYAFASEEPIYWKEQAMLESRLEGYPSSYPLRKILNQHRSLDSNAKKTEKIVTLTTMEGKKKP